jgi:flagellar protein FliO/FliZ
MKRAAAAVFLATLSLSSHAATAEAVPAPSAFSLGGLLQVLVALLLVLAAIVATAWLLKRFGPTQLSGDALKVLGGVAVGPRERLVLVEVGTTWLVVGVAPGQVRAVHTMPRPEQGPEPPAGEAASFAERLRERLGAKKG